MENILELKHITKSYEDGINVIEDLNLTVKKGELITLLGPSGCGKTTLLRMIGGFDLPNSGEILLHGEDIGQLPPEKRPINTVFQKYALFPFLNIYDNIAFGLKQRKVDKNLIRQKVKHALSVVDLEGFEKRNVDSLSGGQQQRVAVARAIVNEPEILLLDEPLSALDHKMRLEMQAEIRNMHDNLGMTFIYVTHDQEEAMNLSDRIVVMANGVIQQEGAPEEIYDRPANIFVADFIGVSNIFTGDVTDKKRARFAGKIFKTDSDLPVGTRIEAMIRPENVEITGAGEGAIDAVVTSDIYKGSHHEITAEFGKYEVTVYGKSRVETGSTIGIDFPREYIHLMRHDMDMNVFDGVINQDGSADFTYFTLAPDAEFMRDKAPGSKVQVVFESKDADLSDDPEAGFVTGNIDAIMYIGDHYTYIVRGDNDEDYYADDDWLWNMGDRVSIVVPQDKFRYRELI
ncbi:MAG: ABC transporter ATP-binding protein [Lachnospiraceae bacterium]|uniref:ABC transporter ATP-binding protein n=1 Tax=Candidatus Weimeria bifida TaxID=2599074 RepID=A0A6N7IWR5_9FIRM|nr:ABC transporter ATP-binding protein [Candidatus Weimeria bifida]RRF94956.1 MAG: ABC transporter ATP-binding protein [Lachnospiraceae bacterium]